MSEQNPYDFIFDDKKTKKSFFGGGGKKERMLIAVAGAIGLVAIIAIVAGIFLGTGDKTSAELLTIAQKQTELVRMADIGTKKARGTTALNLATTAHAALATDQANTVALLKKMNASPTPQVLNLGKDSKTDVLLTQAEQTNRFDEVFTQLLTTQLLAYQQSIKQLHDKTESKTTKTMLAEQFTHAGLLLPKETAKP